MNRIQRLVTITFQAGSRFQYIPETRTIIFVPERLRYRVGGHALLHELSHCLLGHTQPSPAREDEAEALAKMLDRILLLYTGRAISGREGENAMSVDVLLGLVEPELLRDLTPEELSRLSRVLVDAIRDEPGLEERLRVALMSSIENMRAAS